MQRSGGLFDRLRRTRETGLANVTRLIRIVRAAAVHGRLIVPDHPGWLVVAVSRNDLSRAVSKMTTRECDVTPPMGSLPHTKYGKSQP